MAVFHDEVEIEDFQYDEDLETYFYPCPCGDNFCITKVTSGFRPAAPWSRRVVALRRSFRRSEARAARVIHPLIIQFMNLPKADILSCK